MIVTSVTKYPCKCGHRHRKAGDWGGVHRCDECGCVTYRPDVEVTDELLSDVLTRIKNALAEEVKP